MIHIDQSGALLRLSGRFDARAALDLRERLMAARAPRIAVDFGDVDQFDDATLPLLTVNVVLMRRRGHAITLRGLGEPQREALQHFGIDARAVPPLDEELPFPD